MGLSLGILFRIFLALILSFACYAQKSDPVSDVVFWAKALRGTKGSLVAGNKKFSRDCSNFVRASYYGALGKDLFEEAVQAGIYGEVRKEVSGGNLGVVALYRLFKRKYQLSQKPKRGDIVFFDNTYDRNRNKKWDDPLSHAGIVTDIQSDGTVVFIHGGTSRGIEEGFLHLEYPGELKKSGKRINSYIQRSYIWSKERKLSGELVRAFGRVKKS